MPRPWRGKSWDPFRSGNQRLEYFVWQLAALRTARRIARREHVDLAWHVTFANAWMGSIVDRVGTRSVLGPVGGGIGPAWRMLPAMGWRGVAYEAVRAATRTAGRWLNPLARSAWTHADLILAQNRETAGWLPQATRDRTVVFHNVAIDDDLVAAPRAAADRRPSRPVRRAADPVEGREPRDRGDGAPAGLAPGDPRRRARPCPAAGPGRAPRGRGPRRPPGLAGPRGRARAHADGRRVPVPEPPRRCRLGRRRGDGPGAPGGDDGPRRAGRDGRCGRARRRYRDGRARARGCRRAAAGAPPAATPRTSRAGGRAPRPAPLARPRPG